MWHPRGIMCGSINGENAIAIWRSSRTGQRVGSMTGEEGRHADIEVDVLDDAGVRAIVDNALTRAGCTWEELQEQAKAGSFSSEIAKRAWFVVSSFEPASVRPGAQG